MTTLSAIHLGLAELGAVARQAEDRRRVAGWAGVGAAAGAAAGLASARGQQLTSAAPLRVGDVVARPILGGIAEHRGTVVPGHNGRLDVVHAARDGAGQRIARESLKDFRATTAHRVDSAAARQAAAREGVAAVGRHSGTYNLLTNNSDGALRRATGGLRFPSQVGRAAAGAVLGTGAGIGLAKLREKMNDIGHARLRAKLKRANDDKVSGAHRALARIRQRLVTLSNPQSSVTTFAMQSFNSLAPALRDRIAKTPARLFSPALAGGAGLAAGLVANKVLRRDREDAENRLGTALRRGALGIGGAYAGSRLAGSAVGRGLLGRLAGRSGILGAVGRNPAAVGAAIGGLAGTFFSTQEARSVRLFAAALPENGEPNEPAQLAALINQHLERGSDAKLRAHTVRTIAARALMPEADVQAAIESGVLSPVGTRRNPPLFRQSDVEALRAESLRTICLSALAEVPDAKPRQAVAICRAALKKALAPRRDAGSAQPATDVKV